MMSSEIATIETAATAARTAGAAPLDRLSALVHGWTARERPATIGGVLVEWRAAERDLDAATPGSEEWNAAAERFLAARSEYQRLFRLALMGPFEPRHF